jgi:PTH1 family peptidyl-tRNA hydrolase
VKLIVGLGNPGKKYSGTRHNVGFEVLDFFCDTLDKRRIVKAQKIKTVTQDGNRVRFSIQEFESKDGLDSIVVIKPENYMNLSGWTVKFCVNEYLLDADDFIIVADDIALPIGKIRFREKGSSGGQKGIQSIIDELGTQNFSRLRIGIQSEENVGDLADFVLKPFMLSEHKQINQVVETAALSLNTWIDRGMPAAMNDFNGNINDKE